jgi:plasmid stability protein
MEPKTKIKRKSAATKSGTEVTTIRLRPETKSWLQVRAERNDRSMSAELRRIVETERERSPNN